MEYNADLPVCLHHIYIVSLFLAVYRDMQIDSYKSIYYACLFITSLRSIADSNIKLPKVFTCKADSESLKLRIAQESLMHWLLCTLIALVT